jgi:uncharacterized membrane protein YjgN (DUF898 family)
MSEDANAAPALTIEQRCEPKAFLGLSLRNGLLNIVTLTLYRFWGKTEVRRRLWNTTFINDEPLEYTGRGIELFIGFLLALVVLGLPFLFVVFGAQLLGPILAAVIIFPLYILMTAVLGYGQFTAFRYLASRTTWRGVRFLLRGSPVGYGMKYLGYVWLSGFTLGWFWPAAQRSLAEPLWHGLRFGDRKFRFSLEDARRVPVYGAYAIFWVGMVVGYFVLVAMMIAVMQPLMEGQEAGKPPTMDMGVMLSIYAVFGVFFLIVLVLYAPYQAAILRSVAAGISFEGVRFKLNVRWQGMAWLTFSNVVLVAITLGFLMPFVQARSARYLFGRLETEGGVDLSTIAQAAEAGPKHGEGLADAFGISPI